VNADIKRQPTGWPARAISRWRRICFGGMSANVSLTDRTEEEWQKAFRPDERL
jgi:hypothetical protein